MCVVIGNPYPYNVCWGAGIDNDIIDASLNALLSAANRLYEVWQSKEK